MAKVVFFTLPHHGHINPNIGLLEELVKRGEQIICYSSIAYREVIEATGAQFGEYKVDVEAFFFKKDIPSHTEEIDENIPAVMAKCFESVEAVFKLGKEIYLKHYKEIIDIGIDYFMYDSFAMWGMLFAQKLNIPSVCCESSFVMTEEVFNASIEYFIAYLMKTKCIDTITAADKNQAINCLNLNNKRLQRKLGIKNFNLSGYFYSEYLNIVYLVKDMQPCIDNISDKFAFVGLNDNNSISTEGTTAKKDEIPLVFMSRGTIHGKEAIDIFNKSISILGNMNCSAIISTGSFTDESQFNNLPSNIKLFNFVNQKQVLKDASVFITHGGITGVREAISNGVPMIFYPEATDQYIAAQQLEKFGAGIWLKNRPFCCDELKYSLEQIINNSKYKKSVDTLKSELQGAGGCKKAADYIDDFKQKLNII